MSGTGARIFGIFTDLSSAQQGDKTHFHWKKKTRSKTVQTLHCKHFTNKIIANIKKLCCHCRFCDHDPSHARHARGPVRPLRPPKLGVRRQSGSDGHRLQGHRGSAGVGKPWQEYQGEAPRRRPAIELRKNGTAPSTPGLPIDGISGPRAAFLLSLGKSRVSGEIASYVIVDSNLHVFGV